MFRPDILNEFRALAGKADAEWIQRKRKINTETLIVELARGKVNRMGLRQIASQKPGNFSASALVQAKRRIPVSVMAGILSKLNESAFSGRRVLAIDSTKINLPLRFKAQGVAPRNAAAHKPLIMCSTLFNIKADIPLEVIIANHHDERGCLVSEHTLQAGDLVIGDRGYFGQKLCAQLKTRGVDVLLRVKEKACLPVMSFVASRRKERVMDLDGVRVKCFKYAVEHQRYVLVTTNLTMTMSEARTLYKSRWRIEEGFRRWKSRRIGNRFNPVVVFGGGQYASGGNGLASVPRKALIRELGHKTVVVIADEYKTSQVCCKCGTKLTDPDLRPSHRGDRVGEKREFAPRDSRRLRQCQSEACCKSESSDDDVKKKYAMHWNRDTNAAINILQVGVEWWLRGVRPERLRRSTPTAPASVDSLLPEGILEDINLLSEQQ